MGFCRLTALRAFGPALILVGALALPAAAQVTPQEPPPERLPDAQLDLDTGGHRAVIRALAVTPDGEKLWSAGDDKVVREWDLATGKPGAILRGQIGPGNEGTINALALSADGRYLAVAGYFAPHLSLDPPFGDVRIFDTQSGKLVHVLEGFQYVVDVLDYDPTSDVLAVSGQGGLILRWRAPFSEAPERLADLDSLSSRVMDLAFVAGGNRLAVATWDYGLKLFDTSGEGGTELMGDDAQELWDEPLIALTASPDGTAFALAGANGTLQIRDAADAHMVQDLGKQPYRPDAIAWGSRLLAVGCGYGCGTEFGTQYWDSATWQRTGGEAEAGNVHAALALPGTDRFALAGGRIPSIFVTSLAPTPTQVLAGIGAPVSAVAISADGTRIAWGNADPCPDRPACPEVMGALEHVLQLPSGDLSLEQPKSPQPGDDGLIRAVLGAAGYGLIASRAPGSGFEASQLDLLSASTSMSFVKNELDGYYFSAFGLVPERKELITGGGNGVLLAQSLTDGRVTGEFVGHTSDVLALAVAPEANRLLTGSADQTLRLWNLETHELIVSIFVSGEDWIIWTPQGYFHSSPDGDRLVGWHLNQGPDKEARFITARQLRQHLHSPEIVRRAIITGDAAGAAKELRGTDRELLDLLKRPAPEFSMRIRTDIPSPPGLGVIEITGASLEEMNDWGFSVLVNDRRVPTVPIQPPDSAPPEAPGAPPRFYYQIPVEDGENAVLVSGQNDFGYVTERSGTALFKVPKTVEKRGKLYVAVVGIDRYPDLPDCGGKSCDLAFPVADAVGFLRTIEAHTAPLFDGYETLVIASPEDLAAADQDGIVDPATVLPPEGRTITDELIDFLAKPGPDDTTIIFVASHGINIDENFYLIPADGQKRGDDFRKSSLVDWSVIQEEIGYATGRRILMLDTCHAANAFDAKLEKQAADARVIVFSATAANNTAQERRDLGHGIFTYALIQGLSGGAAGQDGVRLLGLADYIYSQVVELSKGKQEPFYHISQTANFLLAQK